MMYCNSSGVCNFRPATKTDNTSSTTLFAASKELIKLLFDNSSDSSFFPPSPNQEREEVLVLTQACHWRVPAEKRNYVNASMCVV